MDPKGLRTSSILVLNVRKGAALAPEPRQGSPLQKCMQVLRAEKVLGTCYLPAAGLRGRTVHHSLQTLLGYPTPVSPFDRDPKEGLQFGRESKGLEPLHFEGIPLVPWGNTRAFDATYNSVRRYTSVAVCLLVRLTLALHFSSSAGVLLNRRRSRSPFFFFFFF